MTPKNTNNNAMKWWLVGGVVVFLVAVAAAFGYFFGQTSQKTSQEEEDTAVVHSQSHRISEQNRQLVQSKISRHHILFYYRDDQIRTDAPFVPNELRY